MDELTPLGHPTGEDAVPW